MESRKLTDDGRLAAFALALAVFSADQASKFLVLGFRESLPFEVVPNVFRVVLVQNTGAAFGFFREAILFSFW